MTGKFICTGNDLVSTPTIVWTKLDDWTEWMMDTSFAQRELFIWTIISSIEIDRRPVLRRFTDAAINGDVSKVVRLLNEGVPVDSFNVSGWTALQSAARFNQTDVIHELLQRGADVNKRHRYIGRTALHWSARYNSTDAIRLLLQNGASTTIKDNKGRTPIDVAREHNHQEAVLLLQH